MKIMEIFVIKGVTTKAFTVYKEPQDKISIEWKGIFCFRTNVISRIEWWAVNKTPEINNISRKF